MMTIRLPLVEVKITDSHIRYCSCFANACLDFYVLLNFIVLLLALDCSYMGHSDMQSAK